MDKELPTPELFADWLGLDYYVCGEGETASRVIWVAGGKVPESIGVNNTSTLGLYDTPHPTIGGIHISNDPDYWVDRLDKDYGNLPEDAILIEIVCKKGDALVEDVNYRYDLDRYDKADSNILLTKRLILYRGVDYEAVVGGLSVNLAY